MEILLIRAVFAPCCVLLVSLAARRLGPRAGGRLLGTPTTTGPFLLLLALADGTKTAAGSVPGCVAGQAAVAGFCVAYGRPAPRLRPARTLAAASAFAAVAELIAASCTRIWLTAAFDATIVLAGLLTPPPAASASASASASTNQPSNSPRRWEIPARMGVSGTMVLIAVAVAGVAGPFVGGLLSSLPVLLMVMAPSIHRSVGPDAAVQLTRGALASGFATLGFLLVLGTTLEPLGIPAAFVLALAALAAVALIDHLVRSSLTRLPRPAIWGRRHGIRAGLQ
jgi:hypothetical protein